MLSQAAPIRVQHVGDRRPQQELRQLLGGAVQELVGEQIGHHRGPPREPGQRARDIGAIPELGRGQTHAAHPALGVTPEPLDVTGHETVLAERGEQFGGLGRRKRQIVLAALTPSGSPLDGLAAATTVCTLGPRQATRHHLSAGFT
jgi:hypothetical protein